MKDIHKSKSQLIDELAGIRKQVAELSDSKAGNRSEKDALRECKERFNAFLDNLGDIVYKADSQGNVTYANKAAEEISGLLLRDIIGKPFLPLFTPESQKTAIDVYQRTLKGETPVYELTMTNGRICQYKNEPLKNKDGKIIGVLGIARDITERRHAEEVLRQSERFRDVFENATIGLYRTAPDGRILMANPALVHMLSYSSFEELAQRNLNEEVYEPEYPRSTFIQRIEREGQVDGLESGWIRQDGTTLFVRESARAIRDENGNTLYYEGSVEDITELKRAEQELRESEGRYRAVVEDQTELICRFLPDGSLTFVNGAYCRYFHKKRDELIGHSFIPLIPKEDKEFVKKQIASLSPENPIITHEHRVLKGKGEIGWQQWTNRVIFDDQNRLVGYQSVGRDITERKRAEEALRESENKLSTIIEHSNELYYIHDTRHKLSYVSPQCVQIFGYSREEMMVKWTTLVTDHPMNQKGLELTEKALKTGKRQKPYLLEAKRKDGEKIIIEIDESPLKDKNGKIIELTGALRDITERKRAEEAFRESEKRLRDVSYSTADWIWEIDSDGTYTYASEKVKQILGYDPEEIIGKTPFELMPKTEAKRVGNIFKKIISEGKPIVDLENWNVTKEGETVCLLTNGVPILNEKGKLQGYRGVDKDITRRKQAEDALKVSEERYRTLQANIPVGIFRSTIKGKFLFANRALIGMYGCNSEEELLKTSAVDFYCDPERREELLRQLSSKGSVTNFISQIRRRDGSTIWISSSVHAVFDDSGKVAYFDGIAEDITERKQAEDKLRKTGEELKMERKSLEEKNIALKEVLSQIEEEKNAIRRQVVANVEMALLPSLQRLKENCEPRHRKHIEHLEKELKSITAPFVDNLKSPYTKLTPRELEICRMIKNGLLSKEISEALNVSILTIHKHRELIRKKLKLRNKNVNLSSYLQSISLRM